MTVHLSYIGRQYSVFPHTVLHIPIHTQFFPYFWAPKHVPAFIAPFHRAAFRFGLNRHEDLDQMYQNKVELKDADDNSRMNEAQGTSATD